MTPEQRHRLPFQPWLHAKVRVDDLAATEPDALDLSRRSASRAGDVDGADVGSLRRELGEETRRTAELAGKLELAARRERELRELLLDAHDQLLRRDDELQAALIAALDRRPPLKAPVAVRPAPMSRLEYQGLIDRIRAVVEATLPEGALVAVVSRGDGELLEFAGRRGLHFPQTSKGVYAGHHPADGASAVNLVESARTQGAEYLVFPATSSWWLSHYTELAQHLDGRYSRVTDQEDCVIFALSAPPASVPDVDDYPALVVRVREAVHAAAPLDATVLVISRGDDELLNLYGRRAWHFPRADDGRYAGHYPSDSDAAIDQLERLHALGASHLVVPATALWWLDHYDAFRTHLEQRPGARIDQDDSCVLFELGRARRRRFLPSIFQRRSQ